MRKYFRISSPSVAASGCLQILQCNGKSRERAADQLSGVAVELLAVQPADVVGLERVEIGHGR